jgi:hypothetical protein
VARNFSDTSEFLLFCIKAMSTEGLTASEKANVVEVQPECAAFLKATFTAKANEAAVQAASAKLEEARITDRVFAQSNDLFARYWPILEPSLRDATRRREFAAALRKQLVTTDWPKADCFEKAETRKKANECFLRLPGSLRRKLVTGE